MYDHSSKIYICLGVAVIFVACSSADKTITIKAEDGDRITNGQNATVVQLPYIVQVVYKYTEDNNFVCGGTIVSDRHVISAAHCFINFEADDLEIVANATYLDDNKGGIKLEVEALYKHRQFSSDSKDNDVAVIKLSKSLAFGQGVQKIKLCSETWRGRGKIIVAGWGDKTEGANQNSNQLQMVQMDTVSDSRCINEFWSRARNIQCAVIKRGKGSCQGDSGGPAIYNGKLCGMVSFGFGCGLDGTSIVFASIPKLRKFINKSMAK